MDIDIIIPTLGNCDNIDKILSSIQSQTFFCRQVIIVCNGRSYNRQQLDQCISYHRTKYYGTIKLIYSHEVYPSLQDLRGPSLGRMIGVMKSTSPYLYCIDDDNTFGEDFLYHTQILYKKFNRVYDKLILCPIVMYHQTNKIQSVGFSYYSYIQARPIPILKAFSNSHDPYIKSEGRYPQMIGGNSLFGRRADFLNIGFDRGMQMTMEDIDWSMRASQLGYHFVVPAELCIYHHERLKTPLEKKFIHNTDIIYYKTYNRIRFVGKYANFKEKILFFGIGLPLNIGYTCLMICFYAQIKERSTLFYSFVKGLKDAIIQKG